MPARHNIMDGVGACGDWSLTCPEIGQYGDDVLRSCGEVWLISKQWLLVNRGLLKKLAMEMLLTDPMASSSSVMKADLADLHTFAR